MQVIDFIEFTKDVPKFFKTALHDEVIINNSDGNKYKLLSINENNKEGISPLEGSPRVKLNITTQEIVKILQDCKEGI